VAVRGGAASVRPALVTVVVEGPASSVARLAPGDVRPYVELSGAGGAGPVPIAFELASGFTGVSVERSDPREVLVRPAGKGKR
jgi:hypothetical protein